MDDLTNWQCPNCGTMNVDCEKETVFPMCEVCGDSFEWLEICPTLLALEAAGDATEIE